MNKPDYKIVCFTCKRDEELLPIHYKQIMKVNPNHEVYYIVDESEIEQMKFPKGSTPLASDFMRNGNLIGIEALQGIIATYSYLNSNILKIDSDIMLMSDTWIETKSSMQGFTPSKSFTIHGSCYFINKECVDKVRHFVSNYYEDTLNNRCEDQTITTIAAIVSSPYKVLIQPSITKGSPNSCIFTNAMFNEPNVIREIKCCINCGDAAYLEQYLASGLDRTAQVKRAMAFVLSKR